MRQAQSHLGLVLIVQALHERSQLVVPSSPPSAHSSRCGSPRGSMTSPALPSCTGNASEWQPICFLLFVSHLFMLYGAPIRVNSNVHGCLYWAVNCLVKLVHTPVPCDAFLWCTKKKK